MRVLVCGGRDYAEAPALSYVLAGVTKGHERVVVIHGGATGADALSGKWAHAHGHRCELYHADWAKYGKAAGPVRNREMIYEGRPDLVVAFAGGKGTANMVSQAKAAGIRVIEVDA